MTNIQCKLKKHKCSVIMGNPITVTLNMIYTEESILFVGRETILPGHNFISADEKNDLEC